MRLEVDPSRFKRLRPVIGQTDRLTVREQREVSRVKHGLALLPERFGSADAAAASTGAA